jgi:hypothetical protein
MFNIHNSYQYKDGNKKPLVSYDTIQAARAAIADKPSLVIIYSKKVIKLINKIED